MKLFMFLFSIIYMPFVFSGCMFNVHYTAYIKDNIKAVGGRFMQREYATFDFVCIGAQCGTLATTPATFSQLKPKFAIKLADGTILTSDEMTYDKISSLPNVMLLNLTMQGTTNLFFFIDGYKFGFDKHEIIYFMTINQFMNKEYNPMIGDINGEKFYSFPITQEQMESIFGTPDKYVNDYRL